VSVTEQYEINNSLSLLIYFPSLIFYDISAYSKYLVALKELMFFLQLLWSHM